MSNWVAAEILLTAAVLALAMPREDGFIIPERRDWTGWLRQFFPRARRQREEEAGFEADRYVTDLRTDRDQPLMTVRADQLPSANRVYRGPLVSPPTDRKPPWKTAENPGWRIPADPVPVVQEPQPEKRPRRAPHDPPTVVIEIMRPAVEGDLGRYLSELPAYTDIDDSAGFLFVPRSSFALGVPDDGGAPGEDCERGGKEDDLHPGQPGATDVPVEHEDVGE